MLSSCERSEDKLQMNYGGVLKPGGSIVIEEPDIRKFTVKLIALAEKITLMRSHFLSPDKIAGLFKFPEAKREII